MGTTHVFVRRFPFSSNVGTYIWNWELGSIGKGDHGLMDTLTVGEVHYENMVCSSLLCWAPIEPLGPFLVEESGVFFSSLEDLSWFVRLFNKIYLLASNMAFSNQYVDARFKIETEISKSARLGDLSTQRKGSKERPGKGSHEYEEINRTRLN